MDSRQLEIFVAVAEELSFTLAAKRLHLVQPAVSMALGRLEQDLGVLLLDRSHKKVRLTAEGQALLLHARAVLHQLETAQREMEELKGLEQGEVRLGVPSMFGSYFLPRVLGKFMRRYPGLRLSIQAAGTAEVQALIDKGELDMGVVLPHHLNLNFDTRLFLREEMVACVPLDHAFAQRKSIPYEDFAREQLVMFQRGYFQRDLVEEVCRKRGIRLQVVLETNLIPTIKAMVLEGFGIASFLKIVLQEDQNLVGVSFDPPIFLDLTLAWRKGAVLSKANRAFLEFLEEEKEG